MNIFSYIFTTKIYEKDAEKKESSFNLKKNVFIALFSMRKTVEAVGINFISHIISNSKENIHSCQNITSISTSKGILRIL